MNKAQRLLLNTVIKSPIIPSSFRVKALKSCGLKIGKNVRIQSDGFYDTSNMSIGDNVLINRFVKFFDSDRNERIEIGNNVMIAMGVTFCTVTHEIGEVKRGGKTFTKPIVIENGSWIGANATILPGITIAKGCVIAAGAVVTKSTEPNGLYAGVPAKRIKEL